jgi:hypothetical protein
MTGLYIYAKEFSMVELLLEHGPTSSTVAVVRGSGSDRTGTKLSGLSVLMAKRTMEDSTGRNSIIIELRRQHGCRSSREVTSWHG